ncbi:MAG TPA: DUF4199 domain-containing protein [Pedobacter sp.]|uniref:DUF4199 domain-containing protein n=1 Tax=Pedobacter sp. TaxID=1411316 RepID=UPI002B6D2B07|nr:DUF4199 domain-containing protein [Pedobacter sp.]HMI03466.1 DUF4199 domain-containing protein [Pedobacter sp.]
MEENALVQEYKPNMLAFKSAVAYAVYFLILIYVFKFLGIDQNDPASTVTEKIISSALSYIPFILAVIYVQTTYKTVLGGYISFGKAFSAGFKTAAYSGLFIGIILILYYMVLDREAYQKVIDTALQAAGDDEQKRKGVEMMRSYMIYFIAFGGAIMYTVLGLIVSLIGAAVVKKEKPLYED